MIHRTIRRLFSTQQQQQQKKNIQHLAKDLTGKHVFVRTDFNVPMTKDSKKISDDTRVRAAVPTIRELTSRGARVIICSHLGRPKGKVNPDMSLEPVALHLQTLIDNTPVSFVSNCVGPEVSRACSSMYDGSVLVLENVRFHKEETENDVSFAASLKTSTNADIYVNDAFGTAHRAHASTCGIASHVSGDSVAGLLMKKELDYLTDRVLINPKHPMAAITGGSKVSTKLPVLSSLLSKVDDLLLGGGMIFTFMAARGVKIGSSICEEDMIPLAEKLVKDSKDAGVRLHLPSDIVIADAFGPDANVRVVSSSQDIPEGWYGMDVGPQTIQEYGSVLRNCRTIVWNGPMGVFEMDKFSKGTFEIAKVIANCDATSIIGGGDSVSAVEKSGLSSKMSHISTGGGASLEMLEGKILPGVDVLDNVV
jgi:phosphoglycerate kinase